MSTTQINQVDELTSTRFLSYINAQDLKLTAFLLKPNTRFNLFFDGVNVNYLSIQEGKTIGQPLISNDKGVLFLTLRIPKFTFTSGVKRIILTDASTTDVAAGTNVSRADATFTAFGAESQYELVLEGNILGINQTLNKQILVPVQPQTALDDSIAQSFFTYGVDGGIFVSSIELYFKKKDLNLPVWVEIREMVNGFPGRNYVSADAIVYKNPEEVNASGDLAAASQPATKFTFNKLIYLPQDREYCFVVRSRSKNYELWIARLGVTTNERTGNQTQVVTAQPYSGSLFKTDNNVTWSAVQFEDLKFKINRAQFNKNLTGVLKLPIQPVPVVLSGARLRTMIESDVVVFDLPYKHGLDTSSVIYLSCDPLSYYNGVAGSLLHEKTFNVYKVINDYAFAVHVTGATFDRTDYMTSGSRVTSIFVKNGGSGYSSTNLPTVTISAPNSPLFGGPGEPALVTATATAVVENGKIVRIEVTEKGNGYQNTPVVTITSTSGGSGAVAIANMAARFGVVTNRIYQNIAPTFSYSKPAETNITAKLQTTLASFETGTISSYTPGSEYPLSLEQENKLDNNFLLSSSYNETENLGGNPGCMVEISLASQNSNVSPVFDSEMSKFVFYNNKINDLLPDEDVNSTAAFGTLSTITLTSGGSGYIAPPTIRILGGDGARAFANLTGGTVTSVDIINPGGNFFAPPVLVFTHGGENAVQATATATITKFNSELLPNNGGANTKYVTKPQILETPSTSIKMFVTAYSNVDSSFEVYAKTSLSSENTIHNDNYWVQLNCDVTRNKSEREGQEFEYEFNIEGLPTFDVYSLKIVLRTKTPWDPPYVSNYRAIILA